MMLGLLATAGCAAHPQVAASITPPEPAAPPAPPTPTACVQYGTASWYRPAARRRRTADGKHPRPGTLTAAHRFLPFGTAVRVTDLETGRSVNVKVDDRGPFERHRVIDLSVAAATLLGMRHDGVARVRLVATPGRSGPVPRGIDTAATAPCSPGTMLADD
jgi:rare lipoprotein A (peptidoglycan hydrolase)